MLYLDIRLLSLYAIYMVENESFTTYATSPKSSSNLISVFIIILIIALLGAGVYIVFGQPKLPTSPASSQLDNIPQVKNITSSSLTYKEQQYERTYSFAPSVKITCINPGSNVESETFDVLSDATLYKSVSPDEVQQYISNGENFVPTILMQPSGERVLLSVALFDCPKN